MTSRPPRVEEAANDVDVDFGVETDEAVVKEEEEVDVVRVVADVMVADVGGKVDLGVNDGEVVGVAAVANKDVAAVGVVGVDVVGAEAVVVLAGVIADVVLDVVEVEDKVVVLGFVLVKGVVVVVVAVGGIVVVAVDKDFGVEVEEGVL